MNVPSRGRRDLRFLAPLLLAAFAGVVLAQRPSGPSCIPCGLPGATLCSGPTEMPGISPAPPLGADAVPAQPAGKGTP